jgi:alpha-L-fucosidase
VSKGGNFLLNVGPTAEGEIPAESVARLRELGRWLALNGEAIYGTTHSPFSVQGQAWRATVKPGLLYLHLLRWPAGGRFVLDGLRSAVKGAFLLADPGREPLRVEREGPRLVVHLPGDVPDPYDSVLALRIEGEPEVDPARRWDADVSPVLLTARDGSPHGPRVRYSEWDQSVSGFMEARDNLGWHLLVKKPGHFRVEVQYVAGEGEGGDEIEYRGFDQSLKARLPDTGGEPRWATLGTLAVAEAGLQETQLHFPDPGHAAALRVQAVRITRID